MSTWIAQPRQRKFLKAVLDPQGPDEILYGGAAGGGKTDALLIAGISICQMFPGSWVLFLRRTFPELEAKPIPRSKELIPQSAAKYNETKHTWNFINGSVFMFGSLDKAGDELKYQSSEFLLIIWDELTHFLENQYTYMLSRNRWSKPLPGGFKPKSIGGTNPGGPGHVWVKSRWIDPAPPETVWKAPQSIEQIQLGLQPRTRCFIPAKLDDNQVLIKADPGYKARLMELPEAEREALLNGNWDSFSGQYFSCWNRSLHTIKPFEIPGWWKGFLSLDYGLDCTACYEHRIDGSGRVYTVKEFYKSNLSLPEAAEELAEWITPGIKWMYMVASPDLWNRRQDTGRQGIEILLNNSKFKKVCGGLVKADDRRIPGWQNMADYLLPRKDEEGKLSPRWVIFDTCFNLIRTLPALVRDEKEPNDVSDKCEDHGPESCRYALMSRPAVSLNEKQQKEQHRHIRMMNRPVVSSRTEY